MTKALISVTGQDTTGIIARVATKLSELNINILDNPQEAAKALLTAEFVRKTKQYEPRVRVMRVEWTQNHARDGGIVPKVVVSFV